MKIRALDISEANSYIKRILINDPILYNLKVRGEISNFKVHSSKNVYLTLKDESSKLSCVIFKNNYDESLKLEDGVKVVANGYISVYERDGSYQLYINSIEIEGIGNLYIEFNKLKEKLNKEGLFDEKYKKPIPKIPKSIGVITSETGAVIRDIINVIKRRYPKLNLKLYPVTVQGKKSSQEICEAIEFFNEKNEVDTIIVGRGGGSIEELWSFNEENVARAVFNSKIPIISAVGHETDFTICDFVADMRVPTPSAAAEIATPSIEDLNYKLINIKSRMNESLTSKVEIQKHMLDNTIDRLNNYLQAYVLKDKVIQLDKIYDKIVMEVDNKISFEIEKLNNTGNVLHSLSPLATLSRGYSIVEKEGEVVDSISSLSENDKLQITLKDGNMDCTIDKINKKEVKI